METVAKVVATNMQASSIPRGRGRPKSNTLTVADLIRRWETEHVNVNLKDGATATRHVGIVVEQIGHIEASKLTKMQVHQMALAIGRISTPQVAVRARQMVARVYNFGMDENLVTENPGVLNSRSKRKVKASGEARERVLSPSEVSALLNRLRPLAAKCRAARSILIALYTGRRASEVCSLGQHDLIDTQAGPIWLLPRAASKNGKAHALPISAVTIQLCRDQITDNSRDLTRNALSMATRRHLDAIGANDACLHDIRRTTATGMSFLGIDESVISSVLNHTKQRSVTNTHYLHGQQLDAMRFAMGAWTRALHVIARGLDGDDPKGSPWDGIKTRIGG